MREERSGLSFKVVSWSKHNTAVRSRHDDDTPHHNHCRCCLLRHLCVVCDAGLGGLGRNVSAGSQGHVVADLSVFLGCQHTNNSLRTQGWPGQARCVGAVGRTNRPELGVPSHTSAEAPLEHASPASNCWRMTASALATAGQPNPTQPNPTLNCLTQLNSAEPHLKHQQSILAIAASALPIKHTCTPNPSPKPTNPP